MNHEQETEQDPKIEIDKEALFAQLDPLKMEDGGYNIFSVPIMSKKSVELLRSRMEKVFQGEYSTGIAPTKKPSELSSSSKAATKNSTSNSTTTKSVLHMINISKADKLFQQFALSPIIGEAVAKVMNWPSVKFAQDQVWCKPPGSTALSFHRDSPYFDMVPQEIATLWITLDDLYEKQQEQEQEQQSTTTESLGPLEYCYGSHKWGMKNNEGDRQVGARTGSASQFFDPDYYALLRSAAERESITFVSNNSNNENSASSSSTSSSSSTLKSKAEMTKEKLKIEVVSAAAGGGSIHNGRTWHGSGPNNAFSKNQNRRGIGIHYVRGDAKFQKRKVEMKVLNKEDGTETVEIVEVLKLGKLWEPLKDPKGSDALIEEHFPTIFVAAANNFKKKEQDNDD